MKQTTIERFGKPTGVCVACGEIKCYEGEHKALNALSRYTDTYICSDCGEREAMEGNFWRASKNTQITSK